MDQIRVGIIGVGRMGERHCRVLSNMRKVQLAGVYDTDPDVGFQVSQQYEVPFYNQIDQLLERVDAVILASPTPAHYEQANVCLDRGLHIFVEKPITETLVEAEKLAQAAERSNLVVQVGHIERFNPAYIELKNVLENTTPLVINMYRLSPFLGSNTDVDVVLDLMIHDTNLVLDLVGRDPIRLNAEGLSVFSNTIDYATAQLSFDGGPVLTMTASRITELKVRSISVVTREAFMQCDLLNKSIAVHRSTVGEYRNNYPGVKYHQESIVERVHIPTFEPLFLQAQHFVDCILGNKPPAVSARDGYKALALAMNIRRSIQERLIGLNNNTTPANGRDYAAVPTQPDEALIGAQRIE